MLDLWAFFETPRSGQRFLISRRGRYRLEFRGRAGRPRRAMTIRSAGAGCVPTRMGHLAGACSRAASYSWRDDASPARLFEMQANGSWAQRPREPALADLGAGVRRAGAALGVLERLRPGPARSHVYVNGVEKGPPPGGDISCANWFPSQWAHVRRRGARIGGSGASQEAHATRSIAARTATPGSGCIRSPGPAG